MLLKRPIIYASQNTVEIIDINTCTLVSWLLLSCHKNQHNQIWRIGSDKLCHCLYMQLYVHTCICMYRRVCMCVGIFIYVGVCVGFIRCYTNAKLPQIKNWQNWLGCIYLKVVSSQNVHVHPEMGLHSKHVYNQIIKKNEKKMCPHTKIVLFEISPLPKFSSPKSTPPTNM